jgi:hypothetical protein
VIKLKTSIDNFGSDFTISLKAKYIECLLHYYLSLSSGEIRLKPKTANFGSEFTISPKTPDADYLTSSS